jgi:phosphopantothenoylcysteine decarboxylase/phosphopantothenate--cysteine ligase
MLTGKKILIGITASIAAYKIITLVRLLTKEGAEVKVIQTPASKDFVSPLVLSTLSKNPVLIDMFAENEWSNHVQLGRWADVMLIAPASCNTIAKLASGICDNLLLATYLSATCPVVIAPAMDEDMWHHGSTKDNLQKVSSYGNRVLSVNTGELASGLYGPGRMAEPEEIIEYLKDNFFRKKSFTGKKVLITAGPTYEAIDPVRFIGNHSSGKMGFEIAKAFHQAGAEVIIISGPTSLRQAHYPFKVCSVDTAEEMFNAVMQEEASSDILVMSAAVADFTSSAISEQKIKKTSDEFQLTLKKTKDILKELGSRKTAKQFLIGFALETENEEANALKKLKEKNADVIVLNSLRDEGAGFGYDTNVVSVFNKNGDIQKLPLSSKQQIAQHLIKITEQSIYENV